MNSPFAATPTFMGIPQSRDFSRSKAVILGLPFDCGVHPHRVGARLGPAAIREQSRMMLPIDPATNLNAIEMLNVVDAGDAAVTPGVVEPSYEAIEAAVHAIASAGAIPITLGGDGAIVLPEIRALHRVHRDLVTIHIDAHTDAYPIPGFNTATAFSRAAEEGVVDTSHSFHVGLRGNVSVPNVYEHCRDLGYGITTMKELRRRGVADVFGEIVDRIGSRPVYLCFDMDFFDPSIAPGVCTPTWGGGTVEEGFAIIEACRRLNIVGCDVNTISPPHDTAGMSAHLAAAVVVGVLNALTRRNDD
jgi:agmatinase